jgi:HD-GYP domain-containing protein (c-di-GMP phosphodiesterase class II)
MAALRLLDLLAGLSRLSDLGYGARPGESLRAAASSAMVARSLGLGDDDRAACLYTALLLHVGCTGYAHETSRLSGDEHVWNQAAERTDLASPRAVLRTFLPALVRGRPMPEQLRLAAVTAMRGPRFGRAFATASCEVGREVARRVGLPPEVQHGVHRSHEWWNGRGAPDGMRGEAIPIAARVAQAMATAVTFDTVGGPDVAAQALRQRAGGMLDPGIAGHVAGRLPALLAELDAADPRSLLLDAEPAPVATVAEPELVTVAAAFGDVADLKSPYLHGHSSGVAELARRAGEELGLGRRETDAVHVAGHLHDVGRVAVSSSLWDKAGPLSSHEREQVRLHAYHSERILAGSERLAPLVPLVGGHHERCDGSGYHRGVADLPITCRVLGAADVYHALTERRPHRPSLPAEAASRALVREARSGRLDADAVDAVLAAAGHPVRVRRRHPAGLTAREVEVLALVAEGCSNREIGERLVISRRTAEQHVQHIYRKIGGSSRAAAALFAMEHRLLGPEDP